MHPVDRAVRISPGPPAPSHVPSSRAPKRLPLPGARPEPTRQGTRGHPSGQTDTARSFRARSDSNLSPTHGADSHRHQTQKDPSCVWHIHSTHATSPDFSARFQLLLAPPEYLRPREDSQGHTRLPTWGHARAQHLLGSQPQTQAPAHPRPQQGQARGQAAGAPAKRFAAFVQTLEKHRQHTADPLRGLHKRGAPASWGHSAGFLVS